MPYVPSEKTDGKSDDRIRIDKAVEALAIEIVELTKGDVRKLSRIYIEELQHIGRDLASQEKDTVDTLCEGTVAHVVFDVGAKYNYDGAWFGELNYAITRLIQVVPRIATEKGFYSSELRYWLYATTAGVLKNVSDYFSNQVDNADENNQWIYIGLTGIFIDILHEYKRRVNTSYEAAQIIKSGDCYTTPYLTQLAEIVSEDGKVVGHIEVMLKREDYNGKDVSGKITIRE